MVRNNINIKRGFSLGAIIIIRGNRKRVKITKTFLKKSVIKLREKIKLLHKRKSLIIKVKEKTINR